MTFYAVFPSNVNTLEFPDNKNNHFQVRLEQPLNLPNGEWEVGLVSIQYPNNWTNVNDGYLRVTKSTSNGRSRSFTVRVREGRYNTLEELIQEVQRTLYSFNFGPDAAWTLERTVGFFYDSVRNLVFLKITDANVSVTFSDEFAEIFGFIKQKQYFKPFDGGVQIQCEKVPDIFKGLTSLYVYTNIVKPYSVGDIRAPLLRVVGINNTSRFISVEQEFRNIHYHEVQSISTDVIEVDIRRDNGERVPFTGGKTILVVHFRKRQA